MRRLFFLAAVITGLFALLPGCGDDEKTPTESNGDPKVTPGDTNDPTFTFMQSSLEPLMYEWFDQSFSLAMTLMASPPGPNAGTHKVPPMTSLSPDQDIVYDISYVLDYQYTSDGWFVYEFMGKAWREGEADTSDIEGIDSIQWLRNGVPLGEDNFMVNPDGLKTHAHVGWKRGWEAEGFTTQRVDIETEVPPDGPVPVGGDTLLVINASNTDTLVQGWSEDGSNYWLYLYCHTEGQNLRMRESAMEEDGCPLSGTLTAYAAMHLTCGGDCTGWFEEMDKDGNWTVVTTFTGNNTVSVTYTDGTTTWTVTGPCD